ncbi:SpvB/TcaC N-terminal domain-containing protein [Streptomyces sp. NPDC002758]
MVTLPKGGGAVRGIGEKFAANPVNGTGSMSLPIATSPGRAGFGPQLALSYDSGAGNGPFGLGWTLSLPAITRRTDKGVPRYRDGAGGDGGGADVFIFSGGEDLVPELVESPPGTWAPPSLPNRTVAGTSYRVQCYRPRIEGAFARIERWSNTSDATDVCWRAISADNVVSWYGRTAESRIADPADPTRIFSWLICESHDDKGNALAFRYKAEDSARIFEDATGSDRPLAHERNRTDLARSAQRYIKSIRYGNRASYFPVLADNAPWPEPADAGAPDASDAWLFEVVFDYGEHDAAAPTPTDTGVWPARPDPFSNSRAGFDIRTYRICRRILMFHHFPDEPDVGRACLVRSTDLTHSDQVDPTDVGNAVYTFLLAAAQTGYRRDNGGYRSASMPPVEFTYSTAVVGSAVTDLDPASLDNAPIGLDGATTLWADLHGEGLAGLLTQHADASFYKRNLSPLSTAPTRARLGPMETVAVQPHADLRRSSTQIVDLAGDGLPDIVVLSGPAHGFYEHDEAEGWQNFRTFPTSPSGEIDDPDLRLVDLTGDGLVDLLARSGDGFVWHEGLGEAGFAAGRRLTPPLDEERWPRPVFTDASGAIHLADMSGDGLADIVRIRNGDVAYWPNLGYGRFGAKVTMDGGPWFDHPDQFDVTRIRVADIDASGTGDLIYVHDEGVRLYFNQSGNAWSQPHELTGFPRADDLTTIVPVDLLGNGTACLVWSSPLPAAAGRPMRYIELMAGGKPHLLTGIDNNLGLQTRIEYAPSTAFYLRDKAAGTPWLSRLPFPVHVVERVTTFDQVSRNQFVSRYAYHHGAYDGVEREFRGFGMVEQFDTEQFAAFGDALPENLAAASHVPPVHIKTWFHTGLYVGRDRVSNHFAGIGGGRGGYFREPGLTDGEADALLLADTVLPAGLSLDEEREACRALRGSMLRQEVYADDAGQGAGTEQARRAATPYTVTEQNFSIRRLQPKGANAHAVFLTHELETISYHYERDPADPRIQHRLTLETDQFGNVRKQAAAAYGRRTQTRDVDDAGNVQLVANPGLAGLDPADQAKQTTTLITYSENRFTNGVDGDDTHRTPLICEAVTFALTGYAASGPAGRFRPADLVEADPAGGLHHRFDAPEVAFEATATGDRRRRPIERTRTVYRADALDALLPLGTLESRAIPGESYRLVFTPGLLADVFRRPHPGGPTEDLLPDPAAVLGGQGGDQGGYRSSQALKAAGVFPGSDPDDHWWSPSGQTFFSPNPTDTAATELAAARQHFFLIRRYRDPFGSDTVVTFDAADLLMVEAEQALGNKVTVEANDYRVLQPRLVRDVNRNRTAVAFDALGLVVGSAVMGKDAPAPAEGDRLTGFVADVDQPTLDAFFDAADPRPLAPGLLHDATTRTLYDYDRFRRTRAAHPDDPERWQPATMATIARETHVNAPLPPGGARFQVGFVYSDGFSREIQRKAQAEPGPLTEGGPGVSPRWVGNGWTILNNKGRPVREYDPFFSATHQFEFAVVRGVSAVQFYDPAGRAIATVLADHNFQKMVVGPWEQTTYDANDCCAARNDQTGDPRTDPDISGYVAAYFAEQPPGWQTWHAQRIAGALGVDEQHAAERAAAHADTPTTVHLDVLGRPFLTVARNRVVDPGHPLDGSEDTITSRVDNDIEDNLRAVRDGVEQAGDPLGRIVARHDYDMAGNRLHQVSMDAGERWTLSDVLGQTIRAWDSRCHDFTFRHDALRRVTEQTVAGTTAASDPRTLGGPKLVDKLEYGESVPNAEALNLRMAIWRHHDSAGIVTYARLDDQGNPTAAYDFKGNLLASRRQLVSDPRALPDWSQAPALDDEFFESTARYDALNRPVQSVEPHSSLTRPDHPNAINVIQLGFNEANLLERIDVWLERPSEPAALLDAVAEPPSPVGITNIDYDAKAQRQRIEYRNGATTTFGYDPLTSRLVDVVTRRAPADFPADDPAVPDPDWPGRFVQNLHYVFDPVGNVTHVHDDAQQTVFFANQRVEPSAEYVYDALYRLVEATGREHLGQAGAPIVHSFDDARRTRLPAPGDGNAMGTYVERYVLDAVGNLLQMRHRRSAAADPGWTRTYDYLEASLIEDGTNGTTAKTSNRLTRTTIGGSAPAPAVEAYTYDSHGSTTRMPHLGGGQPGPNMTWDYRDQLATVDLGSGGRVAYVYDGAGQRVRKVRERNGGALVEERIYLGGFEIYRERPGAAAAADATLERETLHVMEGRHRLAVVETRTHNPAGDDTAPRLAIRYQHGNHLGSVSLELDDSAAVVTYEEYSPYGSTTYSAVRSQTETPKRYRYTAVERDEETGFGYHGARYYVPWLGRWTRCDPIGIQGGLSLYVYAGGAPTRLVDPDGYEPKLHPNFDNGWTYKSMPGLTFYQSDEGYVFTDDGQNLQALDNTHFAIIATSGVPVMSHQDQGAYEIPALLVADNPGEDSSAGPRWHANGPRQFYRNPVAMERAMRGYLQTGRLDYTNDADIWEAGHGCAACHVEHLTNGAPTNSQLDLDRYNRVALLTKVARDVVSFGTGGYDPLDPFTLLRMGLKTPSPQGRQQPKGEEPTPGKPGANEPTPMAPTVGTRKADPTLTDAAANVTPKAGRFDIAVHADQQNFWVRTGPGKNDWAKVPTERVADFMKSKGYTGGPVRLIACEAGALPNGPAQKLANELGTGVLAPTGKVWIHPDGRLTIGTTPSAKTGQWVWFAPQKR